MWTIFVTELEALRIEMIDKPFWGLFENPSSTHGPPPPYLLRVKPNVRSVRFAVKLGCRVLARAAVNFYLFAHIGAGDDTRGCIREGREIRYRVLISLLFLSRYVSSSLPLPGPGE